MNYFEYNKHLESINVLIQYVFYYPYVLNIIKSNDYIRDRYDVIANHQLPFSQEKSQHWWKTFAARFIYKIKVTEIGHGHLLWYLYNSKIKCETIRLPT